MPKYNVPAEKSYRGVPDGETEMEQPRLSIPLKPEWVTKIKLGAKISLELSGKVVATELREGEERSRSEIDLAIDSVEYYPQSESAKLLSEDDDD